MRGDVGRLRGRLVSGGVGRGGKGEEGEGGVTAAQSAVAGLNIDSR